MMKVYILNAGKFAFRSGEVYPKGGRISGLGHFHQGDAVDISR